MCIPHQIPIYLPGFIQETSPSLFGSLRFSINLEVIKSPAFSAIIIVLQGVTEEILVPLFHQLKVE
jgi:hypothetical protein